MKRITLTDYTSPHCPIKASWIIHGCEWFAVFATRKAAEDYLIGRFGNIEIVDKRKEKAE